MSVQTGCEAVWCRYFPTTLKGLALSWFSGMSPGIITNFSVLKALFHQHFIAGRRHKKTSIHLMSIKQQEHESLADSIKRFNEESLKISDLQDGVAFTALMSGLWPRKFRWSLAENAVTTFTEALSRTQKFIQASDICKPVGEKSKKKKEELPYWELNKNMRSNQQLLPRVADNGNNPHFNRNRREIYLDLKHKSVLPIPPPVRTSKDRRDQRLWCEYHRKYVHTTKYYRELKKALDHLADQGKLNRYIKHPREEKEKEKETRNDIDNTDGYVGVIAGGNASGGASCRARKAHLQSMTHRVVEIEPTRAGCPMMTFGEPDRHINTPHDDPLVMEMKIANSRVKRILVDSSSSADIITLDCLLKLKYTEKDVIPTRQPLIGFRGGCVYPPGYVKLTVRLGERGKGRSLPVDFLVVDTPLPYNAIMGRPTMNKIKAAISVYQLLLQSETNDGQVGKIYGDQQTARECYTNSFRIRAHEERNEKKRKREEPADSPTRLKVYISENPKLYERP
ncbi:uncharacterized protein LOC104906890 [Beta vulgaris subsp. vulgaris]|uniref:uncharacterized protein LOC104906890 n=1 Tax=Beta vulgaris subsp. vulgaris TaxID=3555 RepID=UPI00053F874C|nr:uncharacterized protein LOC104906890 [Beta vulgaris subsp. vulgaris]